jgi:hypothetical protein
MKRRNFVLIFVLLVMIAVIFYLFYNRKLIQPNNHLQNEVAVSTVTATNQGAPPFVGIVKDSAIQKPPYSASPAEIGAWERAMDKKDIYWEYKLPISFYGKVVDDTGRPISGASATFSWTDLSPEGTSQKNATTDENGLFSLIGVTGHALSVFVSKEGYKHYYSSNRFSFEYSALASPDRHYEPDSMNPIVFVLRKDRQGENLIVRKTLQEKLEQGQIKSFPIGAGDVFINVERLSGEVTNAHARTWNARVTVPGGGLSLTTEEFPYEAPENDYTNEFVITQATPHPPKGDLGGMFYVKTPIGYGRVSVFYVMNSSWVYVESWFNPNPNSRNLEPR